MIKSDAPGPEIQHSEAVDLLRALVTRPSVSGDEGAIADFVARWLDECGLPSWIDDHGNVHAEVRGETRGPILLLNTHLDTVPPSGRWSSDPFQPTEREGFLFGLGTTDTKGSLAAMMVALRALHRSRQVRRGVVHLVAVVQEEVSLIEAKGTIKALRDGLRADFAICGEPTSLAVSLGCQGMLEVLVRSQGVPAHASDPTRGVNAIDKMVAFLAQLLQIRPREHPLLGSGAINVGVIAGGVKSGVVAPDCEARVGRFTVPGESMATFLGEMGTIRDHLAATDPDLRIEFIPVYESRSAVLSEDALIAKLLVEAVRQVRGEPVSIVGSRHHDDSDFLVNDGGIPTVIFGPGDPFQAHMANEHVAREEVVLASQILQQVARLALA
jgi:acetylornithine deacetylase/succinyl-diaminopimelate desuccinylase-like protein